MYSKLFMHFQVLQTWCSDLVNILRWHFFCTISDSCCQWHKKTKHHEFYFWNPVLICLHETTQVRVEFRNTINHRHHTKSCTRNKVRKIGSYGNQFWRGKNVSCTHSVVDANGFCNRWGGSSAFRNKIVTPAKRTSRNRSYKTVNTQVKHGRGWNACMNMRQAWTVVNIIQCLQHFRECVRSLSKSMRTKALHQWPPHEHWTTTPVRAFQCGLHGWLCSQIHPSGTMSWLFLFPAWSLEASPPGWKIYSDLETLHVQSTAGMTAADFI